MMVRLYARALGIGAPSEQDWASFGEALTVGDPEMDDLVAWMRTDEATGSRELFTRALRDGIDAVPEAPDRLRDFFTRIEDTPAWVDVDKIRRGQRALRTTGADGAYLGRDVALLGGYVFSGFNKTLLRTGALEKGSNRRFAETFAWALDTFAAGSLEPQGIGYQSTLRVRMIHAYVRAHVSAMPDWQAEDWGLPVNQTDMAATLLGTFIAPVMGAPGLGILLRPADLDAVAHLTRYVGWLIGVREDLLPTSYRDAVGLLFHLMMALSEPDETTQLLSVPMAQDPLTWEFDRFPQVRRRLARLQHLSITGTYLGPRTMRALGLPAFVVPWYPLIRIPINATGSILAMVTPGGMDRRADRGERAAHDFMRRLGVGEATIGASARHVTHAA